MARLLFAPQFLAPLFLAALTAGAVHAQTLPQAPKPLDLSAPGAIALQPTTGLPVLFSRAPAALPRGIARTSVERGIGGDGVLSSGVLCGIQPSADTSGAARARGFDPDGKFVGAKMAFRF